MKFFKSLSKYFLVAVFITILTSTMFFVVGCDNFDYSNNEERTVTRREIEEAYRNGFASGYSLNARERQELRVKIEELENEVKYWTQKYHEMREYLESVIANLSEQILSQMSHINTLHNLIIQLIDYGLGDLIDSNSLEFLQTLEQIYVAILSRIATDIEYLSWWLSDILSLIFAFPYDYTLDEVFNLHNFWLRELSRYSGLAEHYQNRLSHAQTQMNSFAHGSIPWAYWFNRWGGYTYSRWQADLSAQSAQSRVNRYYAMLQQFSQIHEQKIMQQAIAENMKEGLILSQNEFTTRLGALRERIAGKGVTA